ncbi:hypothetical protein FRB95_014710 [Tulasnella sp. JGI-2019a]|nr:hypothetical protein FRB95_014710 [Tulasnella sp. JGI-2019a]
MSDPRIAARRASEFKKPRRVDQETSQEQRRAAALAEQKRKRAERIESSRNIDLFQNLSIGSSLPTVIENSRSNPDENDDDDDNGPRIAHQGLAQFASMLPASSSEMPQQSMPEELQLPTSFVGRNKRKKSSRSKGKNKMRDSSQELSMSIDINDDNSHSQRYGALANAIMYAELLEMFPMASDPFYQIPDTLPSDILTGWVALSPIPTGKRCLAVSYQATQSTGKGKQGDKSNRAELSSSSDAGPSNSSRTLLHSRVQGKPFLTFPSPLPPNSILDCILDEKWKETGILHVVDILRWRGKDFVDCETEFRFWWRDAKLSELPKTSPVPEPLQSSSPSSSSLRRFAHPTHFLPVPYFASPLSFQTLLQVIIPAARVDREVTIDLPTTPSPSLDRKIPVGEKNRRKSGKRRSNPQGTVDDQMAVDNEIVSAQHASQPVNGTVAFLPIKGTPTPADQVLAAPPAQLPPTSTTVAIPSDGLLLYVAQASYQPGETPLACWAPLRHPEPTPKTEDLVSSEPLAQLPSSSSPIDTFELLVKRRYDAAVIAATTNGAGGGTGHL